MKKKKRQVLRGALTLGGDDGDALAVTLAHPDPAAVVDYGVRFSAMVPVPDDDAGATLTIGGTIEEKLDGNRVAVAVDARLGENKVLTQARAVVQLA